MKRENIEDVYRLSLAQQGMLFHTLHAARPAMYLQQFRGRFGGVFDAAAFAAAWQALVDANPVFRTFFLWKDIEEPVQLVERRLTLSIEQQDWSALPAAASEARLAAFIAADRERGFDLARPPLMRLAVLRVREDRRYILWTYHHLILDGWSAGLLMQEFGALYEAAVRGRPRPAQARRPFRDYVAWLRQQRTADAESFWRLRLAGVTAPTPLGVDRPRAPNAAAAPGAGSATGTGMGIESIRFSAAETAALKDLAQRRRLTLSTLCQGAWALVLARYARADDVVFGAAVSGRPPALAGAETMLGCFINTLPARVAVPGGARVATWLQELQAEQVKARRFEHTALVDIQGWCEVPRQTPLFDSILVFENFPAGDTLDLAEAFQRTNYPLTLVFGPTAEMFIRADYETDRLETATVRRLLAHLRAALLAFAADPEARLDDVELTTAAERAELRALAAPAAVERAAEAAPRCLHELFAEQAARRPTAVAAVCDGVPLAYGELERRVNRLANRLRAAGVGPEVLVAICLERSLDLVVAIVAVLKAGGAYLPLDPAYPPARLAFMVADAGARLAVTVESLRPLLPPSLAVVSPGEDPGEDSAAGSAEGPLGEAAPASGALPGNLAYVIYTSGSTGTPKGSLVTHANVARLLAATAGWFRFGPADVWTLFHSFAFDFSVWELWGALAHGGRLVVVPYLVSRSPEAFRALLASEAVTVLNQTPSAFRQLDAADAAAAAAEGAGAPPLALRAVIFGGEALEPARLAGWVERHGDAAPRLVNMYGITETTVHVTYRPLGRADLAAAARSPIGRPIPDLELHVLDAALHLSPLGVAGELAVAGAGLARGYLGRPGLTAERFVPHPFAAAAGERLYRSGDLVRRLADGEIEYLGRIDQQIKVRGFRVELGEIEAALAALAGVREAAVLALPGPGGERRLVAFVSPRGEKPPAAAALRQLLRERLPEHMVPAVFVELAALPLNANGKVDRRALAARAPGTGAEIAPAAVRTPPRNPVEEILAAIWCDVLGLAAVGVEESFFDLGGHSLLATRVLTRIRQACEVELPIAALFAAPTIGELALAVAAARSAGEAPAPPITPREREREDDLPLSFAQERLWFLDQLTPGSPAYNIPAAVRLGGALDAAALARALAGVVARHEALRTVVAWRGELPVQVVLPAAAAAAPLPQVDGSALSAARREAELRRLVVEEALRPFDLARGPLLRAVLVRLAADDHALLLTQHHIVSDAWSAGIFIRELAALYGACVERAPSPLAPLAIQYADFALWQRRWLAGEVLERQLAYWRERLAGVPALELPADRPRPSAATYRGASRVRPLAAELAGGLGAFSRRQGATVFMTALAAFAALLARLSGQRDFAVGSPVANRNRGEIEPLIGFFVNTLALRADLAGDPAVGRLLAAVRATALGAYGAQDLPFERVVQELAPARHLARSPLFQVMLAIEEDAAAALALPGLTLRPQAGEAAVAKFDLTLTVSEGRERTALRWDWSTSLFDAVTIERWAAHFEVLLAALIDDPARRLSALPLLSAAEEAAILVVSAPLAAAVPAGAASLHALFAAQAALRPAAVAVTCADESLTYGELEARADRLAHRLRGLGVGAESLVGICLERSLELVVAIVGVLKAGAAYLPLDPAYPEARLAFMVEDAAVAAAVTVEPLRRRLPDLPAVICLDAAADPRPLAPHGTPHTAPADVAAADNLAYVIYTSGSTGRPKGTLVTHANVSRLLTATAGWFGFGPADVWTLFHSYAFDFSVWELWGALAHGGRLVVVPHLVSRSPESFHRLLAGEGVTVLNQTPSAFQQLAAADAEASSGAGELPALRTVIFGGEALAPAMLLPWLARHGDERPRLVNMYGITETTVHVTYRPLAAADAAETAAPRSPIGRAIPDLGLYVIDAEVQLAPPGVAGELAVAGDGVARGYLGRPELTAERFVPHPFAAAPGARLYRSGDLVRRLADGEIDYLGRIDRQIKVRGFRIELGEVEAALAALPALREAAVLALPAVPALPAPGDPGGELRLVAYVVPRAAEGGGPPARLSAELRAELRARLPEHMVPAAFVAVAALPLTANGKLDRAALAAIAIAPAAAGGESSAAPRTPVEELLAAIWCEILGLPAVGIHDGFFDLGGHSLLATRALSRIRQAFDVELPLAALFAATTIAELAPVVAAARSSETAPAPPIALRERSREDRLPLSFAQERLWFLDQLMPGSALYNIPSAVRLAGGLDLGALAAALAGVVARHETLRTVFASRGEAPVQVVSAPLAASPPPLVDASALAGARREAELHRLTVEEALRPFDLARGPLLRAVLVRAEPGDHLLLLTQHHIVSDGWSMGILIGELAALYGAAVRRQPPPLAPLAVQYADFALWQRRWLAGEVLASQLAYWRQRLAGVPPLELPGDRPRPSVATYRGAALAQPLPAELAGALRAVSRRQGTTVFMTALAAFAALLGRLAEQDDFAIGSPVANRNRGEIEPLIGFFVNTLALRADLGGDPAFSRLLAAVRATALGAYAAQDLPFERVVQELAPERNLAQSPIFQVMLALQNDPPGEIALPGLTLRAQPGEIRQAKFDLSLTLVESGEGGGLAAQWVYATDLFDAATIERWAAHLAILLGGLAEDPARRVSTLPLLTAAERRQMLEEWNRPSLDHSADGLVHQLIAAQAARTPEAPAVVFAGDRLTYRELVESSRRFARRLRRLGVGPESLVAIAAERSLSMVVGLLGILEAGAAYVPLDPALPAERLAFMLADSAAGVLVTEEALLPFLAAPLALAAGAGEPAIELVLLAAAGREEAGAERVPPAAAPALLADHPAYVIYTSGSTGRPKGVVISHRSLANRTLYAAAADMRPDSAYLQKTTISFDVSAMELFAPLLAGGRTVLIRPDGQQDPDYLIEVLAGERITDASFPPSLLLALLEREGFGRAAALRTVVTGGETVPPGLPAAFHARSTADLQNRYGPTEATVSVTSWLCERGLAGAPRTLPIGRPTAGARLHVLGRGGEPAPVGVAGELHIGGLCLARGYHRRPDLTAAAFVPDPFAGSPGERLYRTGDLARYRPDGALEFAGRIDGDGQVKIRGFRVELGEIEAALAAHPGVALAAVVLRRRAGEANTASTSSLDGQRLVAYLVAAGDPAPAAAELRELVAGRLPAYMVPSGFAFLAALPTTPTGKIDRRALALAGPEPACGEAEGEAVEPPRGPVEELVAGVWSDVLDRPITGRGDDFFALGGHSLLATRVASRLRRAFAVELPLRLLFEATTVAALGEAIAAALAEGAAGAGGLAPPPIARRPAGRTVEPPLSFAQERLWFLDQLEPGRAVYNIPAAFVLRGPLDRRAMARSVAAIVGRHESLRTTFTDAPGRTVQRIAAAPPAAPLAFVDLAGLAPAARRAEAERLARAEAARPFDLRRGPLLRVTLVGLSSDAPGSAAGEHALLVTLHHIAADGWSMGILVREAAALYDAFAAGLASPLAELPIQYADFALWQRRWLTGAVLEAQVAFWRQALAGLEPLELPADRPRPAASTYAGAEHRFRLPDGLGAAVAALARARSATRFMAHLAAFQALLGRTTGQDDFAVGTPIAGRHRGETEGLIGFFVNTLALRADLGGDPGFAALLDRARERTLAAYAHQDLPFEKLIAELQPERHLARSPVVQAVFVSLDPDARPPRFAGLELSPLAVATGTAKFDLTLSLGEVGGGFGGQIEYSTDLFEPATAARLADHFAALLQGMVDHPAAPIDEIPWLAPAERAQIRAWSGAEVPSAVAGSLHQRFAAQAARRPLATAAVCDGAAIAYGELNARANRLAHHLIALGVGPEVPVALCVERSLDMLVGILGILKAGGAYVPLDPAYPAERLAFTVEDALGGAARPVLVTAGEPEGEAAAGSWWAALDLAAPLAVVHLDAAAIGEESADDPPPAAGPESLAYVIYTSGSTGRPKGVLVTHGNVLRLFAATDAWFGFGPADVWTLFHSYAFDFSVWELWGALLYGGRLVVVPQWVARSPEDLLALLGREGVTVLNQTPSAFRQLVQVEQRVNGGAPELALRYVVFGGEALEVASLAPWLDRHGEERPRLVNMYGITETTVHVTYRPIVRADLARPQASPIGVPIPDLRLHLLDRRGRPAAIGLAGEIHVGGGGVARGYLGRPALTAERFVPDPWSAAPGARLYRAGDLARFRADGEVEFLGRADGQVKIRGFRIEPGEIAAALGRHPAVGEAVVVAREDRPGDRRLVAYLTVREDANAAAADLPPALRGFLRERLPEHMVPAAFVVLAALPLTANGKLDRRALPVPEVAGGGGAAPRNPLEELLVRIWREVLRADRVGIHDNFFELGGDSILGLQVIAKLAQAGWRLTPRQIFERPTVAGLAAAAQAVEAGAAVEPEAPAVGPVPLTPVQRWFLDREPPDPAHFNQAVLLAAAEPLAAGHLAAALAATVARHDALALRFTPPAPGRPAWEAMARPPEAGHGEAPQAALARIDLAALPAPRRRAALEAAAAALQASLDLAAGPLLRAALFAMGADVADEPEADRLLLVVHHLAIDGVSWRVLLEDLETAYRQLRAGAPLALAAPTTPFARWARRLADYARSSAVAAEAAAWLPKPADAAAWLAMPAVPSPLPVDQRAGENSVASLQSLSVALSAAATRALLQEAPRAYRTQINDLLLAALALAFGGWTGSPRLLVELEGHGREELFADLDLSRTVGWFTAIYPLLLNLGDGGQRGDRPEALGAAIKAVKEQLRAVPGRGVAFGLVRYLGEGAAAAALAALPPAEVVFNYLGQLDQTVAPGRLFRPARESSGPARSPRQLRPHVFEITASVVEGRLVASFAYSANRHRRETVERLAALYRERLEAIVAHCAAVAAASPRAATPSDFPLARLAQPELDRLLAAVPGRVEDLYPASYVQEGLLYHSLGAPDSGVYVVQLSLAYTLELDTAVFKRTWERLVARHPVLRTGFAYDDSGRALQVVHQQVALPWEELDWSALSAAEVERRWRELQASDRRRGFDLGRPPLLRFTLVRTATLYRFLWSQHHVILDGWSMPILMRELVALFEGSEADLPPVRPYRDYVAWLLARDLGPAEAFFRSMLAGFAVPTPLGIERRSERRADRPSHAPAAGPASRGVVSAPLAAAVSGALRGFVRRHQLTLNTLMQGAWAILIGRASGEDDVVFGAVSSGRSVPIEGIDGIVGLFINTLPVRIDISPQQELLPWLQAIQERQVEMRQHEYSPLGRVRGWSDVPAGQPLFETILAFENYPVEESAREQKESGLVSAETVEQTNFPLNLVVVPGSRLRVVVAYDTERIERTAAVRRLGELETLLAGMLAGAGATLGEIPSLSEAERHQLAVEWNEPEPEPPPAAALHRLIERRAAAAPDEPALVFKGRTATIGEVNAAANRLAHRLRGLGVGPEVRVGVLAERSPEMVVGLLAVLKAGGTYVPLDPGLPAERLHFMIADAATPLVLAPAAFAALVPAAATAVALDGAAATGAGLDSALDRDPAVDVPLDAAAYVIYTSGSTGRPKGVAVSHRAIFHRVHRQVTVDLAAPARVLQNAAVSFDVSVLEIFGTLAAPRAALVLPEPQRQRDPAYVLPLLAAERVTHASFPPALLSVLLEADDFARLADLRLVITGSEAVAAELAVRLHARSRADLLQRYGPTEAAVSVTSWTCRRGVDERVLPIGRPIAGAEIHLLDRELRPVAIGVAGELVIAGPTVARGYLGRPDLTAAVFVPSPIPGAPPGARAYRTGDLARHRPDGAIEFVGRIDGQVKIRGFRVELGEIESALVALPGIARAAVVARLDPSGSRSLAAFFVPQGEAPAAADLRAGLAARLPAYMVPAHFAALAELPLAPTGKVDRRALAQLEVDAGGERAGAVAPRTPIEMELAGIWAQVLRRDVADVHDDFFALGGHSLLATQVISRLRQAFAVELPLAALFESPTVAGLAVAVEEARAAGGGRQAPPLVAAPRAEGFEPPLSFAQERLWFLDRMQPGTAAYNLPSAVRLEGRLDVAAFRRMLREVVRRHEALRTTFALRRGGPVQVIAPRLDLAVPLVDLAGLMDGLAAADGRAAERLAAEERRLVLAEARRPFDLSQGPLVRAMLVRTAAEAHVSLLTLHHVVSDGWSMGVLIDEVGALYGAFARSVPSPLPELAIQYADFALWQRGWLAGEVLAAELGYWREALAGLAPLDLATDRPRPPVQRYRGADQPFAIPAAAAGALLALGRRQGLTSYITLLAAFQALLHRYTGQDDVVLGTTVAGRNHRELEPLIGFFVNSIAIRADLSGRPSFAAFLGRARETVLGALGHQELPFEKLVAELQPERDLSRSPLFQVVFQLQAAVNEPLALPGLVLRPVAAGGESAAKFDLVLNMREAGGALAGTFKYNTDLFDGATLARMAAHLGALVAAAGAEPERALAELPILAPAERLQLVDEWNPRPAAVAAASMAAVPLHERFAFAAVLDPEAPAASCGEETLTYGDLESQANRLARHLIDQGVRTGDLVGLCLERSLDIPLAILAVLKAGGAYLPLDPAHPAERLAWMLADSGAAVVVTQDRLAEALPALLPGAARPLRVVRLESAREAIARQADEPPAVAVDAAQPAYVIYTSGSTGTPKGVVVSHAQVDRLLTSTAPWFGFGPDDVWTLFHSYAFDFSVWEIWGALAFGGRLVVVPYWVSRSPEAFVRLLADERVTVLNQTPSAFRQLLWAEEAAGRGAPALRWVIFGGEALELASLAPWLARHGDERPRLVNMYGITETTVHVTYRPIVRRDLEAGRGSVLGVPIPDLAVHVIDRALEPQPVGVPGELCVAGAGLASGYLGRPELTAERFVPDPFGGEPGGRLYLSGDRARRLADGDLEYLGRIDQQVKIRGFRIELGEIEAALAAHPAVRQAVVTAREDGGERRLVAYVAAAGGDAGLPAAAELRGFLAARLPDYMLPAAIVALAALPLTANGKVDRRALPAPEAALASAAAAGGASQSATAPRNELERFLAGYWREALGVETVGIDDNFFELGGNSINGAVLISRLQKAIGEIVHVVVIFDSPTVAQMAAYFVDQHPQAIARLFGGEALGERPAADTADAPAGSAAPSAALPAALAAEDVARFRQLLSPPPAAPRRAGRAKKNPPAIFVLAPPRSGTTLLRVMLAGHPRLFAPPELELLSYGTMAERRAAYTGRDAFWLEGAVRAVMEARACGAEEAAALIDEAVEEKLTTRQFYGRLQSWLGGRTLVDKTPSYALDPAALARAEEGFRSPLYLHLVRHPAGMIRSFDEAKLDQIFFRREHPFSRRRLAELIWLASHENILGFLAGVPARRQHAVRFEDLLRAPEAALERICAFLGLDFEPAMARPYAGEAARMTDGIHAESRMLGDVKFRAHGRIDPTVADRWRDGEGAAPPAALGEATQALAERLGYERPAPPQKAAPAALVPPRAPAAGRSLLVALQTEGSRRPFFCLPPGFGEVSCYAELARRLGPDQPTYGIRARGLRAGEAIAASIEEIAELSLAEMTRLVPDGPYLLGGWSSGGFVAYEMACRLAERGSAVALLAIMDANAAATDTSVQFDDAKFLASAFEELQVTAEELRDIPADQRLGHLAEVARASGLYPADYDHAGAERSLAVYRANAVAMRLYRPRPYPGRLVLFRASERPKAVADPLLGWGELARGGVEVYSVPGRHRSMMARPYVDTLARDLRTCLDAAASTAAASLVADGVHDGSAPTG